MMKSCRSDLPTILCDSREQKWSHVQAHLERCGLRWLRSKLPVGDYGRMDDLTTVVDRKASLTEVEGNLIQQHARFRREAIRAQENGIRLIVLVETGPQVRTLDDVARWINPRRRRWDEIDQAHAQGRRLREKISPAPPVDGPRLKRIMETMQEKYGVEWRFCVHQDAGKKILELLGVEADAGGSGEDPTGNPDAGAGRKPWRAC